MDQKEETLKLAVFGYVRRINNDDKHSYNIPKHLIEVIFYFCDTYFKFMENELFKVTNNGWSAHFKSGFGAIQVGDFISNNDKIIITIKFKMYNCDPSFSGIGFVTDSFNNFNHGQDFDLNNNNHSMYLYGNGFYKTSISTACLV